MTAPTRENSSCASPLTAIHQLVAGFTTGDAISNEAIILQRIFRSWGCRSDIFCQLNMTLPELRRNARDMGDLAAAIGPSDAVVLHLSIGSGINPLFSGLKCRKALIYHNITPPEYFTMINRRTAANLTKGREQMKALAGVAEVNIADSRYNALELEEAGYKEVNVLPLILDLDLLSSKPDPAVISQYRDGRRNILFVGRGAPNKKIHDLVTAFYHYRKHVAPDSRLIHVGSFDGMERYRFSIKSQLRELGLDSDSVVMTGPVPQSQLNAFYETADLFLCMSEHEGFCIPLLEAMLHRVPVLAYASAAVPETMAGAGVLFKAKDMEALAEMMGRISADSTFRNAILCRQDTRVAAYKSRDLQGELKQCLAPLFKGGV